MPAQLKKGYYITRKGYVRISAGLHRGKYQHRKRAEDLLRNPIGLTFTPGQDIPETITIHHVDFRCAHNCIGNLLFLDKRIHDYLYNRGTFRTKEPEWAGAANW